MDVDDIVDYIKSLKKGFDKDLFQSKIEELGYIVDTAGLSNDDFNALFKLWLNLSIPITKWFSLGTTIVPQEMVTQSTVEYALRWILGNYYDQSNFSRIGFLLDWMTAAMDCDSVDMKALDIGYELFYSMLTFETLAVHAMKLVYTLTKPNDVTRRRVLELMDYAKKREAKKNMYRQIQVLLGLFKSYKPEYVPEDVPSISIHTAFRKINVTLLTRFKNVQNRRNSMSTETQRLFWINPLNSVISRNKKADPLIPNMEFANIGSKQYDNEAQKNYLDFSDPVSLLQYSSAHTMRRPARLRALLVNTTGLALLAAAPQSQHAFLSHDIHHLLASCFLETSPHSYYEKQDLLKRLAIFQSTLMQGLPVVTRFLAQFLPFWNEKDFGAEILQLVEWVNVESIDHINVILDTLTKIYHRAQPMEQCSILKSITSMYNNLVYSSTRPRHYFLSVQPTETMYSELLTLVSLRISSLCNKGLQTSPEDVRSVWSVTQAGVRSARAGVRGKTRAVPPAVLSLALPLLTPSAASLDRLAQLIVLYKEIFSAIKAKNGHKDQAYIEQMQILKAFTSDFVSCFYEEFLSGRKKGIIFSRLHPQLVSKLSDLIPEVDTKLSIRNHLAFAPYTYVPLQAIDHKDADNKLWFDTVIDQEFANLSLFVKKAMPELH
ncbi:centromere protein I-like [Melitaea cinxia]|uniref:centromere protein I-like n=1 Tax=Melitaea cinxia TaxID=113334 RepID=UPI001E272AD0|nr:centromere protein I-like [Melitaea cinxia]